MSELDSYDALFQVFQSLQPDDSFTLSGLRSEANQDEVNLVYLMK